jgi:hypothetical protein
MTFADSYKLALERVAAGDVTPMMLFPIGRYTSAKYPELPLTRELADEVIANYEGGILGTEPFVEVSGSHDTSAPAGAWVKRVYMAPTKDGGEALYADVKWTEIGARKVSDREYAYNSVELGPVVDNRTGAKTANVLRSVTLTNTPVIRLLPPILEAGDSIALAEPVEVLCSEIRLAEEPDPMASLLADLEAVIGKASETLRGKPGVRAIRTYLREALGKASAHKLSDQSPTSDTDDGEAHDQPVGDASGESLSASEGLSAAEPEPDAKKGGDPVKDVALKLNLAEDASEDLILAEVVKLAEDRDAEKARADAAESKMAEEAKRIRGEAVERTLSELIEGGHLLPANKDEMLALAEDSPAGFDHTVTVLKTSKAIELGERGDGSEPPEPVTYDDPSVELAEKAQALITAGKATDVAAAQDMVLAESPDLKTRLYQPRTSE